MIELANRPEILKESKLILKRN